MASGVRAQLERAYGLILERTNQSCRSFGGQKRFVSGKYKKANKASRFLIHPIRFVEEDFIFGRVYMNGKVVPIEKARLLHFYASEEDPESGDESSTLSYVLPDDIQCDMGLFKDPVYLNRMIEQ